MNWKLVIIVGKGNWHITIKYNSWSRLAGRFAILAEIGAPKRLNLNRTIVRRYAYAESFPERIRRPTCRSMLTPHLAYLEQRYQAGCHNAQQLWRELCEQGYPGSDSQPTKWLSRRRAEDAPVTEGQAFTNKLLANQPLIDLPKSPIELPSTQQLAWLMVRPFSQLEEIDRKLLIHVCQNTVINQVYKLAKEFAAMVRQRQEKVLNDWLVSVRLPRLG